MATFGTQVEVTGDVYPTRGIESAAGSGTGWRDLAQQTRRRGTSYRQVNSC